MLSDASIEKIGWVKNMWQRWIKSKAETNDTILQCDIVSLFRNFRGAASDYLCDFFEEIRKEDGLRHLVFSLLHSGTLLRCKCAGIAREQIFPFTS